ncbi:RNA recognition motif domain-containing protein [Thermodesulfobacteriota bacterium]
MPITIYVGNLSYTVSESELKDLFAPYGGVESAKIISDRYTGNSRGFGFVEMSDRTEGEQAISELSDKDIYGRKIKVSEARPKRERDSYGGSSSRGGRRDF